VLALSTSTADEAARLRTELDLPFAVLADPQAGAVRALGLLHERGGPGAHDIALPAHLLVARGGRVAWQHVATRIQDRAHVDDVLAALQRDLSPP
jgi:peroxiredoxin